VGSKNLKNTLALKGYQLTALGMMGEWADGTLIWYCISEDDLASGNLHSPLRCPVLQLRI